MAIDKENSIWIEPGKVLSIAQLFLLIITLTYVFAYLQKDVERIDEKLDIQTNEIRVLQQHNRDTYVRRDVFDEQYRQIIRRLDNLNEKLDDSE